ncbi:RING finger protein 224 [Dissostichus eleginoides]|uniref:RING finger protein 224 n=1 Tax=Dissostichus eleginoides TaxID=100907 RepID=A0AAD9BJE4_DISEL|nr:RING finger protein 224 [Dissostichus eleginoides]
MADAEVLETQEEGVVTLKEKHLGATPETYFGAFCTTRDRQEDESESVIQPLLPHEQQNHRTDTQRAPDGADPKTSAPQELDLFGRREPSCSGSVRSVCSDSSRHECPICSEPFDPHCVTFLNCNHALCHHCTTGIMTRAKDQSRLQCPFCRQTTPFPQWEIRRLQEESYSSSAYEPGPALAGTPGPELQAVFAADTHRNTRGCCSRGLMQLNSLCLSISGSLLLFLLLLGCFLWIAVPVVMMSLLDYNFM